MLIYLMKFSIDVKPSLSPPHVWSESETTVDPESEDDLEFMRENATGPEVH